MKVLILIQNVTDKDTLNKGIALCKNYASTIGLNLEFLFADTSKNFSSVPVSNNIILNGFTVNPTEIFQEGKATGVPADMYCLVYDWTKITPQPTNPSDTGMSVSIPIQWYGTFPEVFAEFFLHELSHYFASLNGVTDKTHLKYDTQWNHQFDSKTNIEYYLFLIKPFVSTEPYKYFKLNEPTGGGHTVKELKPELMQKLDGARGIAGIPFKINSGFRTASENAQVGGQPNSAHLTGEAVDLACSDSQSRLKIVEALLAENFNRIEIATKHIHCDVSTTLPQNVLVLSENS